MANILCKCGASLAIIPKKCINQPRSPIWLEVKVGRNIGKLFGPRLAGGLKFRVKEVGGLHYLLVNQIIPAIRQFRTLYFTVILKGERGKM